MEVIDANTSRIAIDFDEAHTISVGLFDLLSEQEVNVAPAVAGLLLTLGRLLAPTDDMSHEEEVKFVQASLDWIGAYFTEGVAN